MTNAEKFEDIFGVSIYTVASICKGEYMACEFCKNDTCTAQWWNAEYKEPTTKNDLEVDCVLREQALKCFTICNTKADVWRGIKDLPSVTPQEPILDELRAEITTLQNRCYALTKGTMCAFCRYECEYKLESEE